MVEPTLELRVITKKLYFFSNDTVHKVFVFVHLSSYFFSKPLSTKRFNIGIPVETKIAYSYKCALMKCVSGEWKITQK